MEYIKHDMNMGDALNSPDLTKDDRLVLDPNIDLDKLEKLYGQFASILLQLWRLPLPENKIGSLVQVDDDRPTRQISGRPVSMNMNELVCLGALPRRELPTITFENTTSYLETLADLHVGHLKSQRNDTIDSADDCRRKYVGRSLFQQLIRRDDRIVSPSNNKKTHDTDMKRPFKLWCDDLRPTDILLNSNLDIVGVIDWEFTYSAPAEFSHSPPWWLLLEQPEYWDDGMDDWTRKYQDRLGIFLKTLREHEDAEVKNPRLKEEERLSVPMQRSWENGDF